MDEPQILDFDSPLNQSSYIKVIGVGGGGNNAVNYMYQKGITGVDFIVCNTDMKALNGSPVPNKLVLGHDGMGAGNRPAKAKKAAQEKEEEIKEIFSHNTKMVFITAGMGGGTGTGAAPVIAQYAKEIQLETEDEDDPGKILVVAVVTTPFLFEGSRRIQQANEGVEELRKYVDSILVINNEKLRGYGNLVMSDAFYMANDVLTTAVKGIAEIITLNAYVNIDFRDVNTVMQNSGTAIMGIGEGQGESRALQAVEQATTSVLLNDNDINGAKDVLLYFSYGPEHEITMDEMGIVADYITQKTGSNDTNVIWGTGFDESLGEKVKITLIATGFEQKNAPTQPHVTRLPEPPQKPVQPVTPNNSTDPQIIHRTEQPETHYTPTPTPTPNPTQDYYRAPAAPQVSQPQTAAPQQAQPTESRPHVIVLEDDTDNRPPQVNRTVPSSDEAVLISHTQAEPAATAERPATIEQPRTQRIEFTAPAAPATPRLDEMAMSRADRIRMMHDMLRDDPNGPMKIESMSPEQMIGETLYQAPHSSRSECSDIRINADGTVMKNTSLYDLPD